MLSCVDFLWLGGIRIIGIINTISAIFAHMGPISRDYAIGLLFAGAVAAFVIGALHFFSVHDFPGLSTHKAIVMMCVGGAAAIASTILSLYFCRSHQV